MNQFQSPLIFDHSTTQPLASHQFVGGLLDPMAMVDDDGRLIGLPVSNDNASLPTHQLPLHHRTHHGFLPAGIAPSASTVHQLRHPSHYPRQQQLDRCQRQLCDPSAQLPLYPPPLPPRPQPHQAHQAPARHYHQQQQQQPNQLCATHHFQSLNSLPAAYPQVQQHFHPHDGFPSALRTHVAAPFTMAESDPHDMAAQQEAAKEYQPVHEVCINDSS